MWNDYFHICDIESNKNSERKSKTLLVISNNNYVKFIRSGSEDCGALKPSRFINVNYYGLLSWFIASNLQQEKQKFVKSFYKKEPKILLSPLFRVETCILNTFKGCDRNF